MIRDRAEIAADLDDLTQSDFDPARHESDGRDRLVSICAELRERDDPQHWALLLYSFMERLDTADLGSPGPIVHALESWAGYRPMLAESLRRQPTPLTVWMANRVLNGDPPDASEWLALLHSSANHPTACTEARAEARAFVEYQSTRG